MSPVDPHEVLAGIVLKLVDLGGIEGEEGLPIMELLSGPESDE